MGVKMTQTPTYSPQGNRVERAHRTLGQVLRSDDSSSPNSWAQKVDAAIFEINISRNRITGVTPYYEMYGQNPGVPPDVFFPDNHIQGVLKWTNFVLNLSKHIEDIHEEMVRHEQLCIPVSTEIKIPRGCSNINLGDIVYYMSPRGVINLSKKLTLRWMGPYKVTGTPTESLSVINPIGNWAVNRRELHVLTSRLRKIDPAYYKPVNEQIDQFFDENNEDNEVQISMDRESNASPDVNIDKQANLLIDLTEDEDENVPQGVTETSYNLETPRNISPPLHPQNMIDNPPILQPDQIKLENGTDMSLPQNRLTSTEISVQPPVEKRKYNRRELPPPCEGQGGVRREAFSRAVQKFQQDLKQKKK